MKTYYKNDFKKIYLILEGETEGEDDYRIKMLKENEIAGILSMDVRYMDNVRHYQYDISGKVALSSLYEKMEMTYREMREIVEQLLQTIKNMKKYMLDGNEILLEPEYIFCGKGKYYFCYYPSEEKDLHKEFHSLTEFFVQKVNYQNQEGVQFAHEIHKATMEENYSIEHFLKDFNVEEVKTPVPVYTHVPTPVVYTERIEGDLISEKCDMWEPVKRLLERKKRGIWGYYDTFPEVEETLH